MGHEILIVDDERDIRDLVSGILSDEGYETRCASNGVTALEAIKARLPTLIILDIWLEGSKLDGLELLGLTHEIDPDLPIVMISGHGNIETAVNSIKQGAYDFVEKPFDGDIIVFKIKKALET